MVEAREFGVEAREFVVEAREFGVEAPPPHWIEPCPAKSLIKKYPSHIQYMFPVVEADRYDITCLLRVPVFILSKHHLLETGLSS